MKAITGFMAALILAGPGQEREFTVVKSSEVKWLDAPGMPKGVMTCLIQGDPKTGPYIVLMKLPAGTRVPPHWHSADETSVVQSGTLLVGKGEKADDSKGTQVEAGGYVTIPAKTPHWGLAKTDAVLVRHGNGPADITYCEK